MENNLKSRRDREIDTLFMIHSMIVETAANGQSMIKNQVALDGPPEAVNRRHDQICQIEI